MMLRSLLLLPLLAYCSPDRIYPSSFSVEKPESIAFFFCSAVHDGGEIPLLRYAQISDSQIPLDTKRCKFQSGEACCEYKMEIGLQIPDGEFDVGLSYERHSVNSHIKIQVITKPPFRQPQFIHPENDIAHQVSLKDQAALWEEYLGPVREDVKQGFIANCFLVQVLSLLAGFSPMEIMNKVRVINAELGVYAIKLHDPLNNLAEVWYTVDLTLVTSYWNPIPPHVMLRRLTDGRAVVWPLLFEKAFALLVDDIKRKNPKLASEIVSLEGSCDASGYYVLNNGGFPTSSLSLITGRRYSNEKLSAMSHAKLEMLNTYPVILQLTYTEFYSAQQKEQCDMMEQTYPCLQMSHAVPFVSYKQNFVEYWCDQSGQTHWVPLMLLASTMNVDVNVLAVSKYSFLIDPYVMSTAMSYGFRTAAPEYDDLQFSTKNVPWRDSKSMIIEPLMYALEKHAETIRRIIQRETLATSSGKTYMIHLKPFTADPIESVHVADDLLYHPLLSLTPFIITTLQENQMVQFMGTWILRVALGKYFEYYQSNLNIRATTAKQSAFMVLHALSYNLCVKEFSMRARRDVDAFTEHVRRFDSGFLVVKGVRDCEFANFVSLLASSNVLAFCRGNHPRTIQVEQSKIEAVLDITECE